MKHFIHDTILEKDDICNLTKETNEINSGIKLKKKMVIYGQRNSGKTSLIKNSIIKKFQNDNKLSFVLFCDLMEVKDLNSINLRVKSSFEKAFIKTFPKEAWIKQIGKFLSGLRPSLSVDSITGETTFSLSSEKLEKELTFSDIFSIIQKKISKEIPTLIVLDEFQDIALIKEAQGLFRDSLQKMNNISVIVMGSKKHLLSKMFAVPDAPFADFGFDIEFQNIPYKEYFEYSLERLKPRKIKLNFETSKYWQNLMQRNPEAMNILGAYLVENFTNQEITNEKINITIQLITEQRRSRFEELLRFLKNSEEDILIAICKFGPIKEPSSKDFTSKVKFTHATVLKAFQSLENHSFIEKTIDGYNVCNPLLKYYLLKNR